jgi:molecular chaperone GrpE
MTKHDDSVRNDTDPKGAENKQDQQPQVETGDGSSTEDTGEDIRVDVRQSAPPNLDKLKQQADVLDKHFTDLEESLKAKEDQYLRLAAEFDNYKKRTSREFARLIETANQELIKELLEILDNFKRALSVENNNSDIESYNKGIELIYNQLDTLLKERGLEEIEAVGGEFDPELHEAVMTIETDDVPEDYVAEELQKGYKLKGKVIRHSKVSVAKSKAKNEE